MDYSVSLYSRCDRFFLQPAYLILKLSRNNVSLFFTLIFLIVALLKVKREVYV